MSSVRATRGIFRSVEPTLCRYSSLRLCSRTAVTAPTRCTLRFSRPIVRPFSVLPRLYEEQAPSPSGIPPPRSYSYQEVQDLSSDPSPNRLLIDVRESSELLQTGRIPNAKHIPISSAPDAFFMPAEEFEEKFGFPRPKESDEVIFYCKAGVRSRQAAQLAGQARPMFGGKVGNYSGSWLDWESNGGKVEREGESGQEEVAGGAVTGGSVPSTPRP